MQEFQTLKDVQRISEKILHGRNLFSYGYWFELVYKCRHGFDRFYGTPVTHCEGPPSYPAVPVFDGAKKVGRIGIGKQSAIDQHESVERIRVR